MGVFEHMKKKLESTVGGTIPALEVSSNFTDSLLHMMVLWMML